MRINAMLCRKRARVAEHALHRNTHTSILQKLIPYKSLYKTINT